MCSGWEQVDPSGYCHRKLGGAQGLLLLPFLSVASTFVFTASPQSFASASTFVSAFASQLRLRTLKTAQVALAFASALRFRSARLTMARFYFALRHSLSLRLRARLLSLASASFLFLQDQALDRLVSSSSMPYGTSTDDLSTLSSSRGLTCF